MDEEKEYGPEPDEPQDSSASRAWGGTMQPGPGPSASRRRSGRPFRAALGNQGAGWFVAAFLGGAAVALLIVLLARPSTAVVRQVAATGPLSIRSPRPVPTQVRSLPAGVGGQAGRTIWVQVPGGSASPVPLNHGSCQAVMVPTIIKGWAGKMQVTLPKSARVPAALAPYAMPPWLSCAPVPAFIGGQPGRQIIRIGPGGRPGQVWSWVQAPTGVPAPYRSSMRVCAGPATFLP